MSPVAKNMLIAMLRGYLGEPQFRQFVLDVRELGDGPNLHPSQAKVLDDLEHACRRQISRTPAVLAELLRDAIPPPDVLAEADVPEWIQIDLTSFGGLCPVQGWGTCEGWSWYFRARWEHWRLAASDGSVDPVDVFSSSDSTFYHEEPYGTSDSAAGYMPLDEARYFIVRELTRLQQERRERSYNVQEPARPQQE